MPTLSMFYGIIIQMFFDDHAPPHFHARYGDAAALFDIRTLEILDRVTRRFAVGTSITETT